MGMFSNLMNKIFHAGGNAEAPPDAYHGSGIPESRVQAAQRQGVPVSMATPGAASAPGAPIGPVDVAAVLDRMDSAQKEKLDWRNSIVDLMKLLGMDSSISARKELAADLNYSGDTSDSAKMNIWLHKEVMRKLAENGGKVPADLLNH
jgi:hypothetical protein